MEDIAGDEPELRLPLEKGDGANSDGEKGDAIDAGGANGDGSCSTCTCTVGDSAAEAGDAEAGADVPRAKGGRPSWKARSSNCASQ